ncbi:MAG: hypothetical protein RLZZ157_873, partial [Pseudomonadota bacterium]
GLISNVGKPDCHADGHEDQAFVGVAIHAGTGWVKVRVQCFRGVNTG